MSKLNKRQIEDRISIFKDTIKDGTPVSEAAATMGVCRQTAIEYAARTGVKLLRKAHAPTLKKISMLQEASLDGLTREEAASKFGMHITTVSRLCSINNIKLRHGGKKMEPSSRERAMIDMYKGGLTLAAIGEQYGLSRERVRQLISKFSDLTASEAGAAVLSKARKAKAKVQKEAAYQAKYGCSVEQKRMLDRIKDEMLAEGISYYKTPIGAFVNQKNNAKVRGVEFKLKLWEWWTIWQESGKWDKRGRAADAYVMCRLADKGGYELGNVYISTLSHNSTVQRNNPYRKAHPGNEELRLRRAEFALKKRIEHLSSVRNAPHRGRKYDLPLGVTKQAGKYVAQIGHKGKNLHIGTFMTPEEAHEAYLAKAQTLLDDLMQRSEQLKIHT